MILAISAIFNPLLQQRRFGYLPGTGIFDVVGSAMFPEGVSRFAVLSVVNSLLYNYMMTSIMPERTWQNGDVAKLPWHDDVGEREIFVEAGRELLRLKIARRANQITSPYFDAPTLLLPLSDAGGKFQWHRSHPNEQLAQKVEAHVSFGHMTTEASLSELRNASLSWLGEIEQVTHARTEEVDRKIYEVFDISASTQEDIRIELTLRTNQNLQGVLREGEYKEEVTGAPKYNLDEMVQGLAHYLSLRTIKADPDGVVPLSSLGASEESDVLNRITGEFGQIWGAHASERLREADQALGDRAPSGAESYPNLRAWLNEELFAYHTSTFENTPFLWRLTTERLVPDAKGEGFGCVIDYHQLSASTFDTLHQRYLQPRRAALRERRDAADERRRDQSVPAAERGEAEGEFQRCRSGIEQLEALEDALRELARPQPRDWTEGDRALAEELGPRVARFRERLEERLATLDELWETATDAWLEETFSPTFRERVQENRGEWIDALEDLETACEAYAKPADEPVEAHLYDLFVYYQDDLIGSTHYGSNGIFFLNYYFSKGEQYLTEEGEPKSGLQDSERLLAELARETDADVELGREIAEGCAELADRIPSDWEERALAEVTTAGYRPVKKHGVRINITPLAEAGLVPELVEKKVL